MASTEWSAFIAAAAEKGLQVPPVVLVAKGTGTNNLYMVEVDQATNTLKTTGGGGGGSGSLATSGVYTVNNITGTAQIGNVSGGANLAGRTLLIVTNTSVDTLYWGFDSSVTTTNGQPILQNQTMSWAIADSLDIYLISAGSSNTRIAEAF